MEKKAVITAHDLRIGYRTGKQEKTVHEHLNFQLHAGELTCLLGANGTGKSTLLRTLRRTYDNAFTKPLFKTERHRRCYGFDKVLCYE